MELTAVERHKTIVEQGTVSISIIIWAFLCYEKSTIEKKMLMENFDSFAELYFLIAKFLLESPFKDVAKVRLDAACVNLSDRLILKIWSLFT